ncbi:MAG: UDP-N-acetylmuramate:L-alanyl-gamma-D-glutamyl-meso-diaminopimelate ligase [Desulfobacterales bacterium]|nr:MAG: UDP-N-acetylmuramate:L-alanyl-gamma-D-glutamyl-meso-diaminopimelate ligase [Desulfobacterales bacterium]
MTEQPLVDLVPELNTIPADVKNIHLMGICGTAMAALAGMLKQLGYTITGSDSQVYPPMSDFLNQIGITPLSGYRPDNLIHRPDLVIVGNVITRKNPEAQALATEKIPYISMPQALRHFFIDSRISLVVAGTHGKTTTSSMLASALYTADADPTFMIGGIVNEFNSNYRIGSGPYFVAEGDEYDTAFFNKVSKFLHYRPQVAVITSLEFDHADIFNSLEDIKKSFRKFVSLLPVTGLIVANGEDEDVREILVDSPCPVVSYGTTSGCDYRIKNPVFAPHTTYFSLNYKKSHFCNLKLQLPGLHNCMNATAAAAVMHHLGFNKEQIMAGLDTFRGVKRRQEILGIVDDITVIDDFAHHPTAVRETLTALKRSYPENRLIAVFEPRTNTSRRAVFQKDYSGSFDNADLSIICHPPALKNSQDGDHFSSRQLAEDLNRRNNHAVDFADSDSILDFLEKEARSGDIIALLSNGGFDNIHNRLLERLRKRSG